MRRGNHNVNPKQKMDKQSLLKLIRSLKKYYWKIALAGALLIVCVVLSIFAPQVLKKLTDEITNNAGTMSIDMGVITYYGCILVAFYVTSAICSYCSSFIMNDVTQCYSRDLRELISHKINRLKLKYFDEHPYGDTLSIVTNDVDQIAQSLQQTISSLIQSIFMLIGVMIAMFATSWQMALTVLSIIPLMGIFFFIIIKFAMPQFKKRQELIASVNSTVEENFTGQLIIKLFNAENKKSLEFSKENEKLHWTMFKAQFFGGLFQPIMSFISYFAYVAVCVVGGLLMNKGNIISFGTISAFLVYVNLFQSPLSQIGQSMNSLQMANASAIRVFGFLDQEEIEDESSKAIIFNDEIKGKVEFRNVKFGYDENKTIIPNFSALIKPGMKVAIVGPTGAGKTTMVNLLMRFYEIDEGDILIDDVSTKKMSKREIRNLFGMVLQDTWLFEGTIKENIVYSKENVSDETLNKSIKEANLKHLIETLPGGVNHVISDNSQISSGQKQLITIARAMVENAPLMILDEATSNVDTRTEELIQKAMDRLTRGRTTFVIAHRLSTIRNADMILVMKDGNIIEQGNHDELMKQDGFYASLYNSQFEL